jgi:hypothetical protein
VQQLSYDPQDPVIEIDGWRLGVQVITFENVYGLDTTAITTTRDGERTVVSCNGLTWAGGRERANGSASIDALRTSDGLEVVVNASHERKVRCVKLIVSGLAEKELLGAFWGRTRVTREGIIIAYPFPLHTPLVFLQSEGGGQLYFRSLDDRVRAKRFAFYEHEGQTIAELVFEELAPEMGTSAHTAPWRIGRCADASAIVEQQIALVEDAYGLEAWESRRDVPAWSREIALVAALHGMHWSGRIFNTYGQMLDALRWITARIEGRRVLAFLPGWEGRYYWQYGDYRPEPRLGGDEGFRRLAEGARELGVVLMPMFGMNCANTNAPGYDAWGAPSELRSPGGLAFQGNRPDWDVSRAHDPGWQAWLNPGAPAWRERLIDQVSALVERYQLPAVFFDTQHVWINDAQHAMYEGMALLRDELRHRFPELLIAGEGWYDALGAITPVSQVGVPHHWPEFFARHCRTFSHLSTGDASRGSTGVHELGTREFALSPDVPYWWPTLTVVDGTIERAPERCEEVIAQALRYVDRYLS